MSDIDLFASAGVELPPVVRYSPRWGPVHGPGAQG